MAELILKAALVMGALAAVLAFLRLALGPTPADRAVALDVMTLILMPLMVGVALISKRSIYLDVAMVYAVLSFLGILSLARFLDRGI